MSFAHNRQMTRLGLSLGHQLDPRAFEVRINVGRVRRTDETYYIPDVFVIPMALTERWNDHPESLEIYDEPLPFVAEVWSPSTGDYDIDAKLPQYQLRGDLEIWRLHPFERTLTVWRRQPDGRYTEEVLRGGVVWLHALPDVTVDLDALFA